MACAPRRSRTLTQLAGGVTPTPLGLNTVERNPPGAAVALGWFWGANGKSTSLHAEVVSLFRSFYGAV